MSASIALPRHEMSQCCGCGLEVVQPKLLPCLHTFCLRCLELGDQYSDRSPESLRMACPKCSTVFAVPPEGLCGLRADKFAERLGKMQKGLCDVCSDEHGYVDANVPLASKYCSLCCQGLCERCSVEHSRQKLLKAHPLVEFSVETAFENARLNPSNPCAKHPTVLLTQIFCFTCQRLVCVMCLVEDHMQHKWSIWEEVAVQFRHDLQQSIEQVSGLLGDATDSRQDAVREEECQLNTATTEIESQIRKRCLELKTIIDRHEESLLVDLESVKKTRLLQIDEEINKKFGRYLVRLKTFKNYCTAVKDNGSPNEIDWAVNDLKLRERADELQKQRDAYTETKSLLSSFIHITFELPEVDSNLNNCSFVGKVTSQTHMYPDQVADLSVAEELNAHTDTVSQRWRLNTGDKEAWGVTWLDNCFYVLTKESVLAFDPKNPSSPVEQIDIPDGKYLSDIVASPIDRCLYVNDQLEIGHYIKFNKSCIWKISKELNIHRYHISKWLTVSYRVFTPSVTLEGHVAVPMTSKSLNMLRVYKNNSSAIKTIDLPRNIMFPNHAIELANGNFVIAFGKPEAHGVCEINCNGEIVRSFGDDQDQMLNFPWHLAVFANDDLLLADSKNDRVLWLDSSLNLKEVLLTKDKDGIIEPRRMCYVKRMNLLLIVQTEDGKRIVDVYDGNRWL